MQTITHCPVCCISGSYLGSIRGALPGTLKSGSTRTPPGDNITFHIGNSDNSIIKGRLDVSFTFANLFMGFFSLRHLLKQTPYFLDIPRFWPLPATVFFGPFLVRAFVRVLCP
jgi:hypothetical protein